MKHLSALFSIILLFSSNIFTAQATNPWTFTKEASIDKRSVKRVLIPEKYKTLKLDVDKLNQSLIKAPQRFKEISNELITIVLPMPDETFQKFSVQYSPVMPKKLADKFPEIRTYTAYGIDDPTARVKLDLTTHGFHAMIVSGKHEAIFIEPYAQKNINDYIIFYKKDLPKTDPFKCGFDGHNQEIIDKSYETKNLKTFIGDCTLRTFELALACTGEYASYHGGTMAGAMSALNTTLNTVNGVFETDVALTFVLVPNNDLLIYLNANTDPFTNNNLGFMLSENQNNSDNIIGDSNYDIGHVFGTVGGGLASLGVPCSSAEKASGATGLPQPVGPVFSLDYVSHELGHQFGANHTQNNNCNVSFSTSKEPGSGSTIMSYSGICPPNVQTDSDPYFHAVSVGQIANFLLSPSNNCSVDSSPGNNSSPIADAGNNYTIPGGTPFSLSGSASDLNGIGSMTYCWEQMDGELVTMPPTSSNTEGPHLDLSILLAVQHGIYLI